MEQEKETRGIRIASENETVLRYDETPDEAYIWSASTYFWRKKERLGVEPVSSNSHSRSYRVPKTWVIVRKPKVRELSEEQKAKASAQMKSLVEAQKRKRQEENSTTMAVFAAETKTLVQSEDPIASGEGQTLSGKR